jgi:hypothetical protein
MSDVSKDQKQRRGRPSKYKDDAERKAARAEAARVRRAKLKEEGMKEVRRMVKAREDRRPTSHIIDLSQIYHSKRL